MNHQLKKATILLLLSISILGVSGATMNATYRKISAQQARKMMDSQQVVIVDVRTPQEYAEGHIKDAINIPNEYIGKSAPKELPNKEETILIYCRSGRRSKEAANKLAALGYTQVYDFGGINTWPYGLVL